MISQSNMLYIMKEIFWTIFTTNIGLKSNNINTDETFYMNDNNFTNNTYIGTYLGGFHGFAKLLLLNKLQRYR